ncbi:MAG: CPBP family intramembrane metalloprotease [Oscillospiraceae bacterium]|nr:CPBP family intramembrane metalloprotease [Oscillospiraceae bacterium]
MNKIEMSSKQFKIYLAFAFGLAWILQIVGSMFANNGNQSTFSVILMICMYMPFLGAVIARVPFRGMGWKPHLKGKIRYLFFALWMPALLSILGGGLFFAVFPDAFDSDFQTACSILEEQGALEQLEAQGITIPMYLAVTAILAVTVAPFFNMFAALGEEVGWRGVLYPYLKERLGVNRGRIVGGAVWGAWHWPAMLLAGYEYGKEYIGAPVLGLLVFCVFGSVMGILVDYVYEKTQTIWAPSLLHGAINAFTIFGYLTKPEYTDKAILGPMYIGVISMMPLIITAVIICIKQKKQDVKNHRS